MTNSIASVEVRNQSRGRKTGTKTAKVRRAVLGALMAAEGNMSTKELAKVTKQSKLRVIQAMQWAEKQSLVARVGTQAHEGRGRPMIVWGVPSTEE